MCRGSLRHICVSLRLNSMRIQLSDHFTYKKLLRFVLPSIVMAVFTSLYSIVDGFFVSNYAGKTAFAAINLAFPVMIIVGTFGFMIGTGGNAVVAFVLGQGKKETANRYFSMFVWMTLAIGVFLAAMVAIFIPQMSRFLGADGEMLRYCIIYGRILAVAAPFFLLQSVFQSFFVTAEKPHLSLIISTAAGCLNIVLDFLLVGVFHYGLVGAAWATTISQILAGGLPLIYFLRPNNSLLHLGRPCFYGRVFLKGCTNGIGDFLTEVSFSVVTMIYNFKLLALAGENGVAAYGVIGYMAYIFTAIFYGYALGSASLISYHYGAGNSDELKNLHRKSLAINIVSGVAMLALSLALTVPLGKLFVGYDRGLYEMTVRGARIFALGYLFCGINVYAASLYTALNNGLVAAVVALLRGFVFQVAAIFVLSALFGLAGIWTAFFATECVALVISIWCFLHFKGRYHYA